MARGLDHVVHCVRDLDAAGAAYARLGFQVGAVNRHPWGTWNRLVQMPGFFVELLTVGEPEKIVPTKGRHFSFGAYTRDWTARNGEGLAMLVLESANARATGQAFRTSALGDFEPFHFTREGRRPDGSSVMVSFTLAFAIDNASPDTGFFVCEQHFPENFWKPEFQVHPNGARAIAGVVLVADSPTDHHVFLEGFTGQRDMRASSLGIAVETPRGTVSAMEPDVYRSVFAVEPPVLREGLRLAALRFDVADIDATASLLSANGIAARRANNRLVVPPEFACGAAIAFEPMRA